MLIVGKRAFIAGVADDNGYGWAIAKSLAAAGAEILVGTWVPVSKQPDFQQCVISAFFYSFFGNLQTVYCFSLCTPYYQMLQFAP